MNNWISGAIQHKGGLHKALGVKLGTKISASKMAQARHSKNAHIRRMANLADTLGGFKH